MIVSDSHRFVCLQPWKCGSTTLYRRLRWFDSRRYLQRPVFSERLGRVVQKHMSAVDFMQLPESDMDYFVFVFVRNPYDRVYSGFLQRQEKLTEDPESIVARPALEAELDAINRGFASYVQHVGQVADGTIAGPFIGGRLVDHAFVDGQKVVDFVGHLETFESCLSTVSKHLGLTRMEKESRNVRFESDIEVVDRPDARHRYLDKYDKASLAEVNRIYASDFEAFGYRMFESVVEDDGRSVFVDP